ncbi:hypothetical protein SASPL_150200 [Salvia splendens]|uniref:Uncharacterized protein n=1 Tax=Salvia splendens TaxID=180675 RepID=A0A8X8Z1T1_SALSN|nr:hypothetical protein SASPL_150200 [Salvia splendens]
MSMFLLYRFIHINSERFGSRIQENFNNPHCNRHVIQQILRHSASDHFPNLSLLDFSGELALSIAGFWPHLAPGSALAPHLLRRLSTVAFPPSLPSLSTSALVAREERCLRLIGVLYLSVESSHPAESPIGKGRIAFSLHLLLCFSVTRGSSGVAVTLTPSTSASRTAACLRRQPRVSICSTPDSPSPKLSFYILLYSGLIVGDLISLLSVSAAPLKALALLIVEAIPIFSNSLFYHGGSPLALSPSRLTTLNAGGFSLFEMVNSTACGGG